MDVRLLDHMIIGAGDYTRLVHWGTKPHIIANRKKKTLRWTGKGEYPMQVLY